MAIKAPKATRFKSAGVSVVDKAFNSLGVKEVEALMPLTGAAPVRRGVKAYNGKTVEAVPMDKIYRIILDEKTNVAEAVATLSKLADVEYAEPNYLVYSLADGMPNDPYYSMQYAIQALNIDQLWTKPVISDNKPVIAIIDTGVDISHPDLKDNIWVNKAEAGGMGTYDDDSNGFTDDINGWDFVNETGRIGDYNGHGTHCAGIAAATGYNGMGIIGANPDALIMPLTAMQSTGQGDVATIIKAVDYAAANGADVISMSLGTYSSSMALEHALARAYQNSVIVAAAGNDRFCLNHRHPEFGQPYPMPMFPAAYTFVLGVQASKEQGGLASFSNYDDNGPVFTEYNEEQLYNYELTAPGVSIISTYPGGVYKQLNGTSMATPLVAGAISRLLQTKEYTSKELLFGDLINSTTSNGNLDIAAAYAIKESDRHPSLSLVSYRLDDSKFGDNDGCVDAGETVYIYPKFRNAWGQAKNIRYDIKLADLEDPTTVEILSDPNTTVLYELSSYATIEAQVPFCLKFNSNIVDGRQVKMVLTATCDDNTTPVEQEIVFTVENGVELYGIISEDMTLTPDKYYIVTNTFAVPEGKKLTILPGTTLRFKNGANFVLDPNAIVDINGIPGKMINFKMANGNTTCGSINLAYHLISYVNFEGLIPSQNASLLGCPNLSNCIINQCSVYQRLCSESNYIKYTNIFENTASNFIQYRYYMDVAECCNLYMNYHNNGDLSTDIKLDIWKNSNIFYNHINDQTIAGVYQVTNPIKYTPEKPNYFGTSSTNRAKASILDMMHPYNGILNRTYGEYDVTNMLTRPVHEAHGIVWKVVVDGYDAQDEFEYMPPIGVGKHKFEVYFNRKMNHDATPMIAMGVRPPYTQTVIGEDGTWRTETFDGEEVDIYTAYLTINGRSNFDGLNRIYVTDAQDDEFFEIPCENVRFNVNVQAAGSMSEGFSAEAGLGRVNLSWENSEENFDDMLGYNMYRYTINDQGVSSDTIRVNTSILEAHETTLTDYDVTPGTTYCYFYKVMRTNLSENDPSKTVAVTPLTSVLGDANGSGDVDVADVVTVVNYAAGMNPKPFIFEAADMNTDSEIDILDVVGVIRTILTPASVATASIESTALYFVEDGVLYVNTPVSLAGVQVNLTLDRGTAVTAGDTLEGFENTGAWIADNEYIFMAYSLSGRTLSPGTHALLNIGSSQIDSIRLSDASGSNVEALLDSNSSGIEDIETDGHTARGVYNIMGIKIADDASGLNRLPRGVYIVNGEKIVK